MVELWKGVYVVELLCDLDLVFVGCFIEVGGLVFKMVIIVLECVYGLEVVIIFIIVGVYVVIGYIECDNIMVSVVVDVGVDVIIYLFNVMLLIYY